MIGDIDKVWVPGVFVPRPMSRGEKLWMKFSPLGFEVLPFFALLAPGLFCEYAMVRGYRVVGSIGLLLWAPVLWILLVAIHRAGRVRIWLSAPISLLGFIAGAMIFVAIAYAADLAPERGRDDGNAKLKLHEK